MLNQRILMSGADYFAADAAINLYYGAAINTAAAQAEHAAIRAAFACAGIEVIQAMPPSGCQDGVYTANWGLCKGSTCVLSHLPGPRKVEEDYAADVLSRLGYTVVHLPDGLRFSGQGDALPCGPYLLAGSGYRSDAAAQAFVADALGLELVQLHALPELDGDGQPRINQVSGWPESRFYDIDLAIGVLRDDLIVWCPQAFDEQSRARIDSLSVEKIVVTHDEAIRGFACNLVSTGETVIMSDCAPLLRREIERRGFNVYPLRTLELAKGGGNIRCVALTLG